MAPQVGSIASDAVRGALKGAMGEALDEENQRAMQHFVGSIAQESVRPIAKSLSDVEISSAMANAMTKELGPALQKVLRDNFGPGLAEALNNEEAQRAIGATFHAMGREMVLGANEAFAQIRQGTTSTAPSVLDGVGDLANQGAKLANVLTWVLGAVVLLLAVWIGKLLAQAKRYCSESEQRAATTRFLTEAIAAPY